MAVARVLKKVEMRAERLAALKVVMTVALMALKLVDERVASTVEWMVA